MKLNNRKDKIPYTGLGLIFGAALGSTFGLIFQPEYFALSISIGAGFGLTIGAIIDALVSAGDKKDK